MQYKKITIAEWVGVGYLTLKKWLFKREVPSHLRRDAKRINFGLYGMAWVIVNADNAVLMNDGGWLPVYVFFLKTPGKVIGPRDLQAARTKEWAMEWQQACADRALQAITI